MPDLTNTCPHFCEPAECGTCAELAAAREEGRQEGERLRALVPCTGCSRGYPARDLRGSRCIDCAIIVARREGAIIGMEAAAFAAERRYYCNQPGKVCREVARTIRAMPLPEMPALPCDATGAAEPTPRTLRRIDAPGARLEVSYGVDEIVLYGPRRNCLLHVEMLDRGHYWVGVYSESDPQHRIVAEVTTGEKTGRAVLMEGP